MPKLRKSAAGCRAFAERHGDGVIAALAGILTLSVYLYTIFPGVFMVGDAAKFTFVGKVLGIPHAPGYPLYVTVSHLFSYLPFGTLAYRMNVMSALLGATAVATLYLAGRTLGLERAVALGAALACGLGHAFWAKALYAKTYTLNAALVVAGVLFLLRWGDSRRPRLLYVAIGIFALSIGNHLIVIALLPALIVYALVTDARTALSPRTLAITAGLVSAGLFQGLSDHAADVAAGAVSRGPGHEPPRAGRRRDGEKMGARDSECTSWGSWYR